MIETNDRDFLFHPTHKEMLLPSLPSLRVPSQSCKDCHVCEYDCGMGSKRVASTLVDIKHVKRRKVEHVLEFSASCSGDGVSQLMERDHSICGHESQPHKGATNAKAQSSCSSLPTVTTKKPNEEEPAQKQKAGIDLSINETLTGIGNCHGHCIQRQHTLNHPFLTNQAAMMSSFLVANRALTHFSPIGTGQTTRNMIHHRQNPVPLHFGAGLALPSIDFLLAQQYAASILLATVKRSQTLNQAPSLPMNDLCTNRGASSVQSIVPEQKNKSFALSASIDSPPCGLGSGQSEVISPKIPRLSSDDDQKWLSEFLCLVRSEFVDIFLATQDDVSSRMDSNKKLVVGQVGFRCRYCANIPASGRAWRSSTFPSSISRIYQSFTMMIKDHFSHCFVIPKEKQEQYANIRRKSSPGVPGSKQYWINSAHELGLVDTPNGIHFSNSEPTLGKNDRHGTNSV
mmetsp:Transcript_20279/g.29750  ORF Transcript_20279/g.29750 Transcript_20279/m.29750 type:complete len:456 (-) Transcript_20279:105-1472(-)